jgi:CRP-like cAMP-binding protein
VSSDASLVQTRIPAVSLLALEPDLAAWMTPAEQDAAAALRLVTVDLERGPFDPSDVFTAGHSGFGALVVSGLITREVSLGGQPSLRIVGPGDLFLDEMPAYDALEPMRSWAASAPTQLAILDDRLLLAVRRWPRLMRGVCARLQQGHETTLVQMSISHQPRVEDRIHALFRVLGARWGRVSPYGIVIPMALTHETIGRMVGARRPTVTLTLQELASKGRLRREDAGRWVLAPEPEPSVQLPRLVGV